MRTPTTDRFLATVAPSVIRPARTAGIDPIAIIAQSALETAWGASSLTARSNNLFNIKAGSSWTGPTITVPTQEQRRDGSGYVVSAPFRVYGSYKESIQDYINLLTRRYPDAVRAGSDRGTFFRLLKRGGYASDINYVPKLESTGNRIAADYGSWLDQLSPNDIGIGIGGLIIVGLVGWGVYAMVEGSWH